MKKEKDLLEMGKAELIDAAMTKKVSGGLCIGYDCGMLPGPSCSSVPTCGCGPDICNNLCDGHFCNHSG